MKKNNDGFLLLESLLAVFTLTVGILFMFETILFLRHENQKHQIELELAIFAKEWGFIEDKKDKEALKKKAEREQITVIDGSEEHFVLQKGDIILEISNKR